MKQKITETLEIPSGVDCRYEHSTLHCKKGSTELKRRVYVPEVNISILHNSGKQSEIIFHCEKGNKNHYKQIKSQIAHIKNLFKGLDNKFTYTLEVVNVHFPPTLKVEKDHLIINNFLGEKHPRKAKILQHVNVELKGQKIMVSSHDKEAAGQTAANFEKATRIRGRDRRIYQDGIFIVKKASMGETE